MDPSLIKRINSLPNEEIREVALDAVQRNGYFAHSENLLIAMLGDGNEQIRSMAVTKVITLCKESVSSFATKESFTSERQSSPIRLFHVPTINVKANAYYQFANIKTCSQQPQQLCI